MDSTFRFSTGGASRRGGRRDIFSRIFDKVMNDIATDFGVEPDITVSDSPWPVVVINCIQDSSPST